MHLWFDREITTLDHAVLLDREIHWMYNKSRLQPWRKLKGSYIELVVSASRDFAALAREEAIAQAVRELAEFFPAVTTAKLEKAALVKEVRATFGVPPGIDAFAAAAAHSPWPNCFWPATGSRPAGPPRWRALRDPGTWRRRRSATGSASGSILDPDLKPQGPDAILSLNLTDPE